MKEESEEDEQPFLREEETAARRRAMAYLNLVADAVHNFTDGMAIGAAFLRGGSALGWARTIIILAHELPQEIGDYGMLVGSGMTSARALACNFASVRLLSPPLPKSFPPRRPPFVLLAPLCTPPACSRHTDRGDGPSSAEALRGPSGALRAPRDCIGICHRWWCLGVGGESHEPDRGLHGGGLHLHLGGRRHGRDGGQGRCPCDRAAASVHGGRGATLRFPPQRRPQPLIDLFRLITTPERSRGGDPTVVQVEVLVLSLKAQFLFVILQHLGLSSNGRWQWHLKTKIVSTQAGGRVYVHFITQTTKGRH